jgi:hypothetical protein
MKYLLPLKKPGFFPDQFGVFLFCALFLLLAYQPQIFAQSFEKTKEIRLDKQSAIQLFSLKKADKTSLRFFFDGSQKDLEMEVINHLNPGEKSGALALRLFLNKEEARLLFNRKERNGKLVYWLAILPASGEKAFKLEENEKNEFVLIQVDKDQVVTQ